MTPELTALADRYYVASQLTPPDVEAAAKAGFTLLVNNRPDDEEDDQPASAVLAGAAAKAGMAYIHIPINHLGVAPHQIAALAQAIVNAGDDGKTLAFCMTGKRSALLWAHRQAREGVPVSEILDNSERAGFHFAHYQNALDDWRTPDAIRSPACNDAAVGLSATA
ncbi:MAG: TIGR01244 family phosphatase [Parvularculaceae bacterium]|nr:TIGR01244 family phosphatase [Parvularculaceae bacterium]